MKVAIITDQHFGMRKGSQIFHDYMKKFYDEVFFPFLDKNKITTVLDLGDTFDNRKSIDFWSLDWAKNNYYDPLALRGIKIYTVVGNHTAYYKNTLGINAIKLLLQEYENVHLIERPETINVGVLMSASFLGSVWIMKQKPTKRSLTHQQLLPWVTLSCLVLKHTLDTIWIME